MAYRRTTRRSSYRSRSRSGYSSRRAPARRYATRGRQPRAQTVRLVIQQGPAPVSGPEVARAFNGGASIAGQPRKSAF